MKPNLIIFKHPEVNDNNEPQFVSFTFSDVGMADVGNIFTVKEGDNYLDMDFDHIVLACKVPEGSIDLQRYKISSKTENPDVMVKIYNIESDELNILVHALIREFNLTKLS
jgi:hypothetical protein